MTISYYIHNRATAHGECLIKCYIRGIGSQTIYINTNIKIPPTDWLQDKQMVRKTHPRSSKLNYYLNDLKNEILAIYAMMVTEKNLTAERFKAQILNYINPIREDALFPAIDLYIEQKREQVSKAFLQKLLTMRMHLVEYQKVTKHKLTFSGINIDFGNKFVNYMIKYRKCNNNSIGKNVDVIKMFIRWAVAMELTDNTQFLQFSVKSYKVDVVALTEQELQKLAAAEYPNQPGVSRARDIFLFSCYTGARHSDLQNLQRSDIRCGIWHLRVAKTRDVLQIPLSDRAMAILQKYAGERLPLPRMSNQKCNEHLHIACELAGIDEKIRVTKYVGSARTDSIVPKYELITMHTGRRTFVTLSLERNMRPEVVMRITGHKELKTFMKYARITSKITFDEFAKAWGRAESPAPALD